MPSRVRQPDRPRRHAADDCRVHQSGARPVERPSRRVPWKASNRGFEYDSLGDRYARFLLEEIIPEVEKTLHASRKTPRCGPSAAPAPAASVRSPSPGSGPSHSARSLDDRQLHESPRRQRLSVADPQDRAQAAARLHGRHQRRCRQRRSAVGRGRISRWPRPCNTWATTSGSIGPKGTPTTPTSAGSSFPRRMKWLWRKEQARAGRRHEGGSAAAI